MRLMIVFFAVLLGLGVASCANGESPVLEAEGPFTGRVGEVTFEDERVASFTLETEDTGVVTIHIEPNLDYGFDLAHLEEHAETGDPVIVTTERDGQRHVALSIEDG